MSLLGHDRTKVLAVFNKCTETTIPFENFLKVNPDKFEKHILSFYQTDDDVAKSIAKPELSQNITYLGLNTKRFLFLISVYRLFVIFLRVKPDIVHVHHNISGLTASVMALAFRKTKVIATVHNDFNYFNLRQKSIFLMTYILSDLIVCNSCNTKNSIKKFQKLLFSKTPIKVIYNGIDTQKIISSSKSRSSSIESHKPYTIGTVGRLIPQKDHKTLIKAFSLFHKKHNNSSLVIIGEGKLRKQLEQLVMELHLQKNVTFRGLLTRIETYQELGTFDLFIMSSKWEGFCNAMVEAMVAGIPVLASNVQPLPEVLGHDKGIFFQPGNIDNLYNKMLYCFQNCNDLKKLAENACEYAKANYSLTSSVNYYEDAYKTLVCVKK